jgi:hypothetical protein
VEGAKRREENVRPEPAGAALLSRGEGTVRQGGEIWVPGISLAFLVHVHATAALLENS